jgi:hypothetical protein
MKINVPLLLAIPIVVLWIVLYAAAAFVDPSLAELAKSMTPVMTPAAGLLFGAEAVRIFKGGPQ